MCDDDDDDDDGDDDDDDDDDEDDGFVLGGGGGGMKCLVSSYAWWTMSKQCYQDYEDSPLPDILHSAIFMGSSAGVEEE